MFAFCIKLKEIKGINNFNLSNVTQANKIFEKCFSLKNYNELTFLFDENNNPNFKPIKKLKVKKKDIIVNFLSIDQNINCSIKCCNLDIFSTLIEKLCLKYDILNNNNIILMGNGKVLKKNLTLEQNKIKNGDQILIDLID